MESARARVEPFGEEPVNEPGEVLLAAVLQERDPGLAVNLPAEIKRRVDVEALVRRIRPPGLLGVFLRRRGLGLPIDLAPRLEYSIKPIFLHRVSSLPIAWMSAQASAA